MRIAAIELTAWRNYTRARLEMSASPTILIGENGQGKTNFAEAIVYAALGRSHRTWSDATLVKQDEAEAIVRLRAQYGSRVLDVDLAITASGSNTIRVNGNPMKRKDLARLLPLVIFAPEDMNLVRGEPESRRHFIDDVLLEVSATAAGDLADFERILRQRNTLLKSISHKPTASESATLDTWTASLVDVAARIIVARRRIVAELAPRFSAHYSAIAAGTNTASMALTESIGDGVADSAVGGALRDAFHVKRAEEIDRGSTLVGPHRDDLYFELNGLGARTHSSQGEAWSVALALKLAMVDVVRAQSTVGDPVVILDDVFSELDEGRRTRLAAHLTGIEHLIITAADEATIPVDMVGEKHRVKGGLIDGESS
ncbi:MAG: replication and repair protein RecF [Actinomycetota bacterium]